MYLDSFSFLPISFSFLSLLFLNPPHCRIFRNRYIFYDPGCKFTMLDSEIGTLSIHFRVNNLLYLLTKTAFIIANDANL